MKYWLLIAGIVSAVGLLVVSPVLAATYFYNINVSNNGTAKTTIPIIATMPNATLAAQGFMSASGLDTRVVDGTTVVPHMLADDKSLFVGSIGAAQNKTFQMSTGNTTLASFPLIVGQGGYVTTNDSAALEMGDSFDFEIVLYLGATGVYAEKQDAYRVSYNATSQTLTVITGNFSAPDHTLTATGVASGLHTIRVTGGD